MPRKRPVRSHFRRALTLTVLLMATCLMVIRFDRGPKLHSAVVDDVTAWCAIRHIPKAAFAPPSQALVEHMGLIPRDLDGTWSLSAALEQELLPALRKEFTGQQARRTQELVNQYRPDKLVKEGDQVLWTDVNVDKRQGNTFWSRPLVGPGLVLWTDLRRIKLITSDGLIIKDSHFGSDHHHVIDVFGWV